MNQTPFYGEGGKFSSTDLPLRCDVCNSETPLEYFDAATRMGPWANMCRVCFSNYGIGLGTGRGQHYIRDATGDKFHKARG